MRYEEAIKRLEEIVSSIENNSMDIDAISEQVKEAKGLIKLCKERLVKTEKEIQKTLEEAD